MAISVEHRSKFAALNRQWWRLQMSEKFSSGRSKQTNNQTDKFNSVILHFGEPANFHTTIITYNNRILNLSALN